MSFIGFNYKSTIFTLNHPTMILIIVTSFKGHLRTYELKFVHGSLRDIK